MNHKQQITTDINKLQKKIKPTLDLAMHFLFFCFRSLV